MLLLVVVMVIAVGMGTVPRIDSGSRRNRLVRCPVFQALEKPGFFLSPWVVVFGVIVI